jgi:hypothetical protein
LKKEAFAGLDIRNANNGLPAHYRVLYLALRQRPMSREHARPRPPAGSPRYGRGAEEPAPVPVGVGVTGHRTQRPRAQGPSWTPRTTPSPTQLLTGPRGRTGANNALPGSSDRAAGHPIPCTCPCPTMFMSIKRLLPKNQYLISWRCATHVRK